MFKKAKKLESIADSWDSKTQCLGVRLQLGKMMSRVIFCYQDFILGAVGLIKAFRVETILVFWKNCPESSVENRLNEVRLEAGIPCKDFSSTLVG